MLGSMASFMKSCRPVLLYRSAAPGAAATLVIKPIPAPMIGIPVKYRRNGTSFSLELEASQPRWGETMVAKCLGLKPYMVPVSWQYSTPKAYLEMSPPSECPTTDNVFRLGCSLTMSLISSASRPPQVSMPSNVFKKLFAWLTWTSIPSLGAPMPPTAPPPPPFDVKNFWNSNLIAVQSKGVPPRPCTRTHRCVGPSPSTPSGSTPLTSFAGNCVTLRFAFLPLLLDPFSTPPAAMDVVVISP
mmetsp:Transcript_8683/g.24810  ORF Transcript_8683/g.24810 Transcript_8683/m.24810 type:complete len:243 (+) Transcript_8683:559-1287(+)